MNAKWWNKLSTQEQQTVKVGSIVAAIILAYALMWSPFMDAIQTLHDRVSVQQTQLLFLQNASNEIQKLRKSAIRLPVDSKAAFLTAIDTSLKASQLASQTTNLKQLSNNQVQINFNSIPFDRLMTWLEQLWKNNGIQVQTMQVHSTNLPGMVQVNLVLA